VAASKAAMRGATILKASDDKTRELNKHTLMAFSGEAGDTGMSDLEPDYRFGRPLMFHSSAICRVHTSQHPALFDAKRYGPRALSGRKLRSRRACEELEIKETIYRQLALGGIGSYHEDTQSLLDGLFSGSGTCSLCSSRIRSVRRRRHLKIGS